MLRPAILVLGISLLPAAALSQPAVTTLQVEFKLETATFSETLAWISGWARALTELGHSGSNEICLAQSEHVHPSVLLNALNARFKGQRITSEQASPVLLAEAKARYGCNK